MKSKLEMVTALVPYVAHTKRVTKQSAESALDSLDLQEIRALFLKLVPTTFNEKEVTIASIIEAVECTSAEAERIKAQLQKSTVDELLGMAVRIKGAKYRTQAQVEYDEQERKDFEVFVKACRTAFDTGGPAISAIVANYRLIREAMDEEALPFNSKNIVELITRGGVHGQLHLAELPSEQSPVAPSGQTKEQWERENRESLVKRVERYLDNSQQSSLIRRAILNDYEFQDMKQRCEILEEIVSRQPDPAGQFRMLFLKRKPNEQYRAELKQLRHTRTLNQLSPTQLKDYIAAGGR